MNYVDGYVVPVPNQNRELYRKLALEMAALFKENGALRVVECWGDDVPEGKLTSFPLAVQCQPDETVVFSWSVWPSKQVRDAGMKKVMEHPSMQKGPEGMPFDGKRMIFGGFQVIVDE
ncbi:DUF1428 domain-containing protein [Roseateles sp. NT4]|uniref:DUF1428 domain-containing protein n=1 Tax=Roseateles sp. NT4 TaxID=3453715 RepID=UPI003EEE7E45